MVQFTFQIMESIAIYVTCAYFLTAYAFELIVHYHDTWSTCPLVQVL